MLGVELLKKVLEKHKGWLNGKEDGKKADLRGADLRGADLSGADLRGADLRWASLSGANLTGADLSGADLRGTDLRWASLSGANLSGADLRGADLRGQTSEGADLRGADLREADLSRANLSGAKNVSFPLGCPEVGEFVAFKKAANNMIVKLKIPASAKRSSATTRKCRCDKAIVLSIENADGTQSEEKSVSSVYDKAFVYTVGQEVSVPDFDDNRWNECSTGIHFFITRQEAAQYEI